MTEREFPISERVVSGREEIVSQKIPEPITEIEFTFNTEKLEQLGHNVVTEIEVSFDNGATWRSIVKSRRVGGPSPIDKETRLPLTTKTLKVSFKTPLRSNATIRAIAQAEGRAITIGNGRVITR